MYTDFPRNRELIEKCQKVERNLSELNKLFFPIAPPSTSRDAAADKQVLDNLKEVLNGINSLKTEYENQGEYFIKLEKELAKHKELIDKLQLHSVLTVHAVPTAQDDLFDIDFISPPPRPRVKKTTTSSQTPPASQETRLLDGSDLSSFIDDVNNI
jgi:hypothetical protein